MANSVIQFEVIGNLAAYRILVCLQTGSWRQRWVNVFEKELQPGSSKLNLPLHPKTCKVRSWWGGPPGRRHMKQVSSVSARGTDTAVQKQLSHAHSVSSMTSAQRMHTTFLHAVNTDGETVWGLEVQGQQSHPLCFSRGHASCRKWKNGSLSPVLFCLSVCMSVTLSAFIQSRTCS